MRVVYGSEEARSLLLGDRGLRLDRVPPEVMERTCEALGEPLTTPVQAVELILRRIRDGGDAAINELARRLDGAEPDTIDVPRSAVSDAYDSVPAEVVEALKLSARRVEEFHELSKPKAWMEPSLGCGIAIRPIGSVGVYVPGGTAPYPSTVLMTVIPAGVAGVGEVSLCTPPGPTGTPPPVVLVAADIAGVERIYRIGGAQAIAAMAYGTETVSRVDMICGPGNLFVTLAKKLLFGEVGIDGLYGPTETVIIADESANPTLCAADLLAQAEHDPMATSILITTSDALARSVDTEVDLRVGRLERGDVARSSIDGRGCIVVVDDLEEALELANDYAPEHLSLMVREPSAYVDSVKNAGALFLGELSHEVLGDYVAGPSHVMPTAGTARFSSGLGVHSFVRISPVVALGGEVPVELTRAASALARAEGFTAHAEAAEVREELTGKEG